MIIFNFIKDYFVQFIICSLIGYLLGSLNFSIIFTRLFSKSDIRDMGSHNAGFTNVLRCVGILPAVLTFICDLLKSILAIYISTAFFKAYTYNGLQNETIIMVCQYITGIACILGHMYPCFFRLKGGKGVVATVAAIAVIDYRIALSVLAVFIVVLLITRIVSLSSIIAVIFLPILTFAIKFFIDGSATQEGVACALAATILSSVISVIVVLRHRPNIKRLRQGEENKLSVKK